MKRISCVLIMVGSFGASAAMAQQEGGKDDRHDDTQPAKGDPLPSLDELLGTEGDGSGFGGTDIVLPDGQEGELDQLLSGREIVDEFRAAVDLMGRSARRIGAAHDTSISTQRMQEDALRKLDKLIADAEKRAQQGGNSSSSSANNQQPQQSQQPNQQSNPQAGKGDNHGEATPPGLQTGALRPEDVADLAAWGALPARLRDALVQGSTDRFSATYRKLTEAYYRMLAEEPKQ